MTTEAPPSAPEWLPRFEEALENGDPLGASDTLRKSGVNGWVRKDHYDRALEVIDRLAPAPIVRLNWAERLLAHPRRVDKELAALVVTPLAQTHWRELSRITHRLARDGGLPGDRPPFDRLVRVAPGLPELSHRPGDCSRVSRRALS